MSPLAFPTGDEKIDALLMEFDRRMSNLEGRVGEGLSHNDLKDIEDHKRFLKDDGSVPLKGNLDLSKSGQIINSKNRILNAEVTRGDVRINDNTNQLSGAGGGGGVDHSKLTNLVRASDGHTGSETYANGEFVVFNKASGNGIKVDGAAPTFGFADLLGEVFQRNTGASKPTRAAWKGGTFGFQFAAGKNEEFEFHIRHDHVKGTEIFLHIHWGHNGALVTGGTITFDYELTYAKGHGQGVFGTNAVSTIVSATATTAQYSHEITEAQVSASGGSGTQIDTDILEPDGVIKATIGINANNLTVSGGGVPDPFIHYTDIHYQTNGIMGTKAKAPDFYA